MTLSVQDHLVSYGQGKADPGASLPVLLLFLLLSALSIDVAFLKILLILVLPRV